MTTKQIASFFFLMALLISSCASPLPSGSLTLRAAMADTATPALRQPDAAPTFTSAPSETPTIEPTATMAMRATPTLIAPLPTLTWTPLPTLTPIRTPAIRQPDAAPTWNGVVANTAVPVVVATSPALDADGGYYDYAAALEIVRLTNEFRAQNGKKPLTVDERLMDIARKRAKEIVTNYSHAGLDAYCDCGENIVRGGIPNPLAAVNSWLNSDGHRTNMLHIYSKIGVGVYVKDGLAYYSQEFDF
jgi:uncharacterized protein YkwD